MSANDATDALPHGWTKCLTRRTRRVCYRSPNDEVQWHHPSSDAGRAVATATRALTATLAANSHSAAAAAFDSGDFTWECQLDNGRWVSFDREITLAIEEARTRNPAVGVMFKRSGIDYFANLAAMQQECKDGRYTTTRKIRRFSGAAPAASAAANLASRARAAAPPSRLPAAQVLKHVFVYDGELAARLESEAAPLGSGNKHDNALVAAENYRLVQDGRYTDAHGALYSLELPRGAINRTHKPPRTAGRAMACQHQLTRFAVANIDTATALRALFALSAKPDGDHLFSRPDALAALNFANQHHPGGGYLNGARAQEEDLCRLIPTLYSSLRKLKYPMKEYEAHYTQGLLARHAGSYRFDGPPVLVSIVSAAMPNIASGGGLRPGSSEWDETVRTRIRAVLHAVREERCECLVLGAFGCGAFGNPPQLVAAKFAEALSSPEFRGAFGTVVFAILGATASDTGNLASFHDMLGRLCRHG